MRSIAIGLTGVGLLCCVVAAVGSMLAVLPFTPGKLAFYTLVALGRAPRLVVIGVAGCLLAAPGAFVRSTWRWPAQIAVVLGASGAALSAALTAGIFRAARSGGLSLSLKACLIGNRDSAGRVSEVITFVADDGHQLWADLYTPRDTGRLPRSLPAVVVVHGGAWQWGDKGEIPEWNEWLAARGYVVLDVQYRLAPAADWQRAVADIRSAVAWLRSHDTDLGVDSSRVALLGRSAGGHLALMAAYCQDQADLTPRGVAEKPPWRVIAFYAPADLSRLYSEACFNQSDDVREGLCAVIGHPPSNDGNAYRLASPLERVHSAAPPTLLIHGAWDSVVKPAHSRLLACKLDQAGVPVQFVSVPFARHAFDLAPGGPATQLARASVAAFLADVSEQHSP